MRVYEFAKEHELQTKDVLKILKDGGFSVASHMSVLSDDAIDFLKKQATKNKSKPEQPEKVLMQEKEVVAPIAKSVEQPKKTVKVPESVLPKEMPKSESSIAPAISKGEGLSVKQSSPKIESPVSLIKEKSKTPIVSQALAKAEPEVTLVAMTLAEAAERMHRGTSDLILTLLKWGTLSNKNQLLPVELIGKLAEHYQIKVVKPVEKHKVEDHRPIVQGTGKMQERMPIVVVMGHVDHGKTTLLDFIRKTRVAAKEKGGITQHLGAYEAVTKHGNVVFIDTPGHEAFSKIRIRGAKVADIAVLVVAADDGIMPQTVEAIKHIKTMKVPVIVAINKIDKVEKSRIDIVKRDLATQFELLPEEWGGQTIYIPISAKNGTGVDQLLEMLVLQAQMMDLKAETSSAPSGFVLESKLEKGRGPVATLLLHQGILKIGDHFVCGKTVGRVSSLVDTYGNRLSQVYPAHPVQVAGFVDLPEAGDTFEVVSKEEFLKAKQSAGNQKSSLPRQLNAENAITLLIKTDTISSQEALLESIEKISKKSEKGFAVLQAGIGEVSESDIMLAADTGSRILTLHVKSEPNALSLAQRLGVSIQSFDIIYKLLEHLQEVSEKMKTVKMSKVKVGEAIVRKVFDIKNLGVIAGSYVKEGILSRDGSVVIYRGAKKIGEGKITSLQREKHSIKEAHAGFECAFMVDGFKEWHVDDRVECFVERPVVNKK